MTWGGKGGDTSQAPSKQLPDWLQVAERSQEGGSGALDTMAHTDPIAKSLGMCHTDPTAAFRHPTEEH